MATLGDIRWPDKYNTTVEGGLDLIVPIDLNGEDESFYCWALIGWRSSIQDDVVWYDTGLAYLGPGSWHADFNFGYHNEDLNGIYTLRIGLTFLGGDAYSIKKAEEVAEFNFYVGEEEYYWYDAELEYVYQYQCEIFSEERFWLKAKSPDNRTRVLWHKHDSSPDTVFNRERIPATADDLLEYRLQVASYWDEDQERAKYHYVLAGIHSFSYSNDTTLYDIDGLSTNPGEISAAAAGWIDEYTPSVDYLAERIIKYSTATHELAHIVGYGLSDYCDSTFLHDASSECIMKWRNYDTFTGEVSWRCGDQVGEPVNDAFYFCDECLARLNSLEFLLEDESW